MSTKKRTYNSQNRQAQAAETKKRILTAAKSLFQTKGFDNVTIEQIAQKAEVSGPTVYALFQSKRGILRVLMDEVMPPEQHSALVEKGKKEKNPAKRLQIAAKIARQLYDAEKAQMDIFPSASVLAPEFKELEREREARRYDRLEETVQILANENALAKDLTVTKARDILWALTGRDIYRMFVIERGWTSAAYEKWLGEFLIKALL